MMRKIRDIGRGAYARVEQVRLPNGEVVARKVFDPLPELVRSSTKERLLQRFKREVNIQKTLDPAFHLKILDSDLDANPPWFTMPLATKTLEEEIQEARSTGLAPSAALADILNSLEDLHAQNLVHRDLKPSNILLVDGSWKLADFSLVRPAQSRFTSAHSSGGTTWYCSPEQMADLASTTAASDIFSFGCILHDIFGNDKRVPYQQATADGAIGFIIEKCTESNPMRRYGSATELRSALIPRLQETRDAVPPTSPSDWKAKLQTPSEWDEETLREFVAFAMSDVEERDGWNAFGDLTEDALTTFYGLSERLGEDLATMYCEWAQGASFAFSYCDLVVKRLEVAYNLGRPRLKAKASIAAARMGRNHNRWFVMGRIFTLCGRGLDDSLAERIAMEIQEEGCQDVFRDCAEWTNKDIRDFHHLIFHAIKKDGE